MDPDFVDNLMTALRHVADPNSEATFVQFHLSKEETAAFLEHIDKRTEELSLYRQAYDLTSAGVERDEVIKQLGVSQEVIDGGFHGSVHGFAADLERCLRMLPREKVPSAMVVLAELLRGIIEQVKNDQKD